MRLVACFLPQRPEFSSRFVYLGFMVSKVVPRLVFSGYIGFHCQFSFHQTLRCRSNGPIMVKLPKNSFSLQSKNEKCHGITRLLWNTKVRYTGHKSSLLILVLSKMNPVHTLPPYYFRHTYSDTPSDIFTSGFPTKILYPLITSPCVFHTLRRPK